MDSEYYGGKELEFFYDESGSPYAFSYKSSATATPVTYYYLTNLQGDIVGILNSSGTSVASYTYNAWGKLLSATGDLAEVNPLRYRGYYYDTELEMYYLKSRYYDPEICRFINADNLPSTGQDIIGCNMFVYCGNNPVSREDSCGTLWEAVLGGAIAGAAVSLLSYIVTTDNVTMGGALAAAGVGAATGALSAVTSSAKIYASLGAGLISGIYSGISTEGSTWKKICTGVVTGTSTFVASYIPALATYEGGATVFDDVANVYANYKLGFAQGTRVEIVTELFRRGSQKIANYTQPYIDEFVDTAKNIFYPKSRNAIQGGGLSNQIVACVR